MAIAGALASTVALAADVHLEGGANAEPALVDQELALLIAVSLSGLGDGDVLVEMDATARLREPELDADDR